MQNERERGRGDVFLKRFGYLDAVFAMVSKLKMVCYVKF